MNENQKTYVGGIVGGVTLAVCTHQVVKLVKDLIKTFKSL